MNDILHNQHLRKDPFAVPQGYFEQLHANLASRLPLALAEPQKARIVPLTGWQRVRPWLSAAAVVALMAITTHTLRSRVAADAQYVTTGIIAMNGETAESDAVYDYLMLNSNSIYEEYDDAN